MHIDVRPVACLAATLLLNACSIFAEEKQSRDDAGHPPADACPRSECRVWPDYGDLGMVESAAFLSVGRPPISWAAHIPGDCDPQSVYLQMELVDGRGAFTEGIRPGMYPLEEIDLDTDTCSICLYLVADNLSEDARCFFATAGVLNLSSTEERLVGSLDAITYQQISCLESPPVEGSCATRIGHLEFDTEIGSIEN